MNYQRIGTVALMCATILVAASILLDGNAARFLNGGAGLTWFLSAGLLGVAAAQSGSGPIVWTAVVLLTGVVAFLVRPTDFLPAIIGFGVAGGVIALLARTHVVLWAKVIVALYLPFHIGTAVASAIYRSVSGDEARIRTEPPPTAAVIPLVMLLSAILGAVIVRWLVERRQSRQHTSLRSSERHIDAHPV